jgi:signal transduction histidine kinase
MKISAQEERSELEKLIGREIPDFYRNISDSIIVAHLARDSRGKIYLILLSAEIQPLASTVNTLRIILIVVTVIMLIGAALLALLISKSVSNPVATTTDEAKKLATGNYDVHFSGKGLRETEELGETLNYAAGELSKVGTMQQELVANISHDLRTPLTMISGYSEVMRDIPGEMTPENMQIIIDETARLTSLVNDTLDLTRLTSGKQILNLETFSLTDAVRSSMDRYNKLISRDGYRIVFDPAEDVLVYADKTRILQVVYNLINNAVSYTGDDKTVIIDQTVSNGTCRISVTDSGPGIPEDKLPLIWERYYKLSEYHRRGAMGSGLGLAICKNILQMHGAVFGVSSELGKGSTFWFELPELRSPDRNGTDADSRGPAVS